MPKRPGAPVKECPSCHEKPSIRSTHCVCGHKFSKTQGGADEDPVDIASDLVKGFTDRLTKATTQCAPCAEALLVIFQPTPTPVPGKTRRSRKARSGALRGVFDVETEGGAAGGAVLLGATSQAVTRALFGVDDLGVKSKKVLTSSGAFGELLKCGTTLFEQAHQVASEGAGTSNSHGAAHGISLEDFLESAGCSPEIIENFKAQDVHDVQSLHFMGDDDWKTVGVSVGRKLAIKRALGQPPPAPRADGGADPA